MCVSVDHARSRMIFYIAKVLILDCWVMHYCICHRETYIESTFVACFFLAAILAIPCKRFKDTVNAGLQWCDIPPTELVATALDRQRWRTLSQSASSALEEERRHQAQSARERRHLAASIPATNVNFQCPDCARLCKSRIGLQSHSRTHR